MRFVLNGQAHELDGDVARARVLGRPPESINVHWVEIDGKKWPPKQAFEAGTGINRAELTTHTASRHLDALGFRTSWADGFRRVHAGVEEASARDVPSRSRRPGVHFEGDADEVSAAFATLVDFVALDLTTVIGEVESRLVEADGDEVAVVVADAGLDHELLRASLLVRQVAGRINDVIHATVIGLALPQIMQPGEVLHVRPSLGAGNDPGRRYDVETSHRVAEFKVALWRGADAMRKRTTFADLVTLALDDSERKAQLYVVGEEPIRFLRTSKATATWALNRSSPKLRERFSDAFGDSSVPIREFTAGPAGAVELVDLTAMLPFLAGGSGGATSSH